MSQSIFETTYNHPATREQDLADVDSYKRKAYLLVKDLNLDDIITLGYSTTQAEDIATNGFWEMIITEYSESHSEKYSLHNTLSDSTEVLATGASPIGISITGYLITSPEADHRVKFLKQYLEQFRARVLDQTKSHLSLVIQSTRMFLVISTVAINTSVQLEDFTTIALTGVGYGYNAGKSVPQYETGDPAVVMPKEENHSLKGGHHYTPNPNLEGVSITP